MDVLTPKDTKSHRDIVDNIYSVYCDFSDEYLREWYKPDTTHVKKALTKIKEDYVIDKAIFKEDTELLSKKEKTKNDLIIQAYDELESESQSKDSNDNQNL